MWGLARALGGRVLLRIEDHDRGRCRPEYEAALLADLEWLGLEPDIPGPLERRPGRPPIRQSAPAAAADYDAALARLSADHEVYACDCSRREIALAGGDNFNEETRYPGRCRMRGLGAGSGRGIRVVLDEGVERFEDALLGWQTQAPAEQCGDLLLRDRLGQWTYQFSVTVDDLRQEQEMDLVIRGQDLLSSTGRQIRLARMLGRNRAPVFLHHPLLLKESGAKLSKASRDTGIGELRAAGVSPGQVLGEAAHRLGLLERPRQLRPADLADLFAS